eukprot:7013524-Prorocentrum_lima.AAC.1
MSGNSSSTCFSLPRRSTSRSSPGRTYMSLSSCFRMSPFKPRSTMVLCRAASLNCRRLSQRLQPKHAST